MKFRKTWLSAGSLMVVYLLLGSTALAMFLPQAQFSGIQLGTTDAHLLVSIGGESPELVTDQNYAGVTTLQPGMEPYGESFWVSNDGGVGQDVRLKMRLENPSGDWEELKDLIQIQLVDPVSGTVTEWYTPADYATFPISIPGGNLLASQTRQYEIRFDFADTYPDDPDGEGPIQAGDPIGNELMGKSITGANLVITGTPVSN